MPVWSDGWQIALLRMIDVDATTPAVKLLTEWQRSTPVETWTNNPLGMPAVPGKYPPALPTKYAIFPDMGSFREEFAAFIKTRPGIGVHHALTLPDRPALLWRAVSSLRWPGSETETDYPAHILDMTTIGYRDHVNATIPADRKSAGHASSVPAIPDITSASRNVSARAAASLTGAANSIRSVMRMGN